MAPLRPPENAAKKSSGPAPYDDEKGIRDYEAQVRALLDQEKFEQLDTMASELRATKARFPGGFWKIHIFYMPLYEPAAGWQKATDSEFAAHIARLEKWIAQRPKSITPRVALAGTYLSYAQHARGGGYADTVGEEGWRLYGERSAKAGKILADAFELPEKCPEWFLQMQGVVGADEAGEGTQRAIFEKAVAFEPDYQYYYRIRAEYLLPKWGGEEGEMAQFAAAAADRLGGARGDMIYYQVGSYVSCSCDNNEGMRGMSWQRIKRGYLAVEEKYGPAITNVNKITVLAATSGDAEFAQQGLDQIGDHWVKEFWRTREYFDEVHLWAELSIHDNKVQAALNAADANLKTSEGQKYDAVIAQAFASGYATVVDECYKRSPMRMPAFMLAIQVAQNGTVEQAYSTMTTDVTRCLLPRIQTGRFPNPPGPGYWVKISMQTSPEASPKQTGALR